MTWKLVHLSRAGAALPRVLLAIYYGMMPLTYSAMIRIAPTRISTSAVERRVIAVPSTAPADLLPSIMLSTYPARGGLALIRTEINAATVWPIATLMSLPVGMC
jgi:hypothetical protein